MDELIDSTEDYIEIRNKPGFIAYSKSETNLNKDNIIVKAIFDLGTKYKMEEIVSVLINAEQRTKWDNSVREYVMDKQYDNCLMLKRYEVIFPMPLMQNREFVEKQLAFNSKGKFYVYSSSVDNSLEPLKPTLTRATTFICGSRIVQDGDSIKITMISQMDMKLLFPTSLLSGRMADEMEQFKIKFLKQIDKIIN